MLRHIGEPNIRLIIRPTDIFRRQIRRQHHPRARMPRRQYRAGKQRRIIKPQRSSLHALRFQTA